MYAPYFGLSQEPFSIAPDPRYLYMSERHREALAHLLYGLGAGGGFVLLTGEIGTGKTTVCRCFLEQVPPTCHVAYIFNPKLTVLELLQSVCDEFRIELPGTRPERTVKDYVDALNGFLLQAHAQGHNSVLVIDEAQNLSADVLEQLRLLTNLETSERKLLQIILIGQPELRDLLARPDLEQLAQRIVARSHLGPLDAAETAQYVRHRLAVAGLARAVPFDRRALAKVHRLSGGVPRRINLLCDRALLGAYARSEPAVTAPIVEQAAREVFGARHPGRDWRAPALALGLGVAAGAAVVSLLPLLERDAAPGAPVAGSAAVDSSTAEAPPPVASASQAKDSAAAEGVPGTVPAVAVAAVGAASAPAPMLHRTEQQAWRELARAWGVEAPEGEPCQAVAREGLQCFTRVVPLSLIRQLDRPGIVTLDRDTGRPSYAVLTALDDKSATLSAGGTRQTVTLAALAARWSGEWGTLWRLPGQAEAGSRSALVRWAEGHLGGDSKAPLAIRVRNFQLAQGLPADGMLGPLTYMQLNRAAGVAEPRLQDAP